MSISSFFSVEEIFSPATRDRCIQNFMKLPVPKYGRIPTATAAVLLPLCVVNSAVSLIYTVRSTTLRSHSGQISFPGGKTSPGETSEQTALRETQEEIGLPKDKVEIWGSGRAVPGRDNKIMITPVVGVIRDLADEDIVLNLNEVSEVFAVSLQRLCHPDNQFHTQFKNGYILPVFMIEQYKIWGITAYITHGLLSAMLPKELYNNEWMKRKISLSDLTEM